MRSALVWRFPSTSPPARLPSARLLCPIYQHLIIGKLLIMRKSIILLSLLVSTPTLH